MATMTLKPQRTVTASDAALMAAWLTVISHVSVPLARSLIIDGLQLFAGHACVRCASCIAAGTHASPNAQVTMRLPSVAEHLRRWPDRRHEFVLACDTLRVIP